MSTFKPNDLVELLPVYYKRLFPFDLFCSWLSYGSENFSLLAHREMSFTLPGDVYIRYQSFDSPQDFEQEVIKKCPEKIDIGAIYNIKPRQKRMNSNFEVEEKELIFDIDMTDYDNVRTCCSEAEVCNKCWKLLAIATKILDSALRDDFGFEHLLWVFSGRRGVHCWVCDDVVRKLEPKVRADIAEYLQLLSREDENGKLAKIPQDCMHPSIKRALNIIKEDFETMCVVEQDMLGAPENVKKVVAMLGDQALRNEVQAVWEKQSLTTSLDRWNALVKVYQKMHSKNLLKKSKYLIEEIMLHYAYPRLDIEVSKGSNHLLKAPFCIHPKTGKVCVPFNPSSVHKFNPQTVPTISILVDEIQKFDAKDAEKASEMEKRNVGNLQKTSMYKGVQVFKEFLRKLQENANKKNGTEGMEF